MKSTIFCIFVLNINEMTAKKGDKHPNHVGNQFWRLRNKDGRHKIFDFSTPENIDKLLEQCQEYFNITDTKYTYKQDFIRSGERAGEIIQLGTPEPYTIEGLCQHLGIDVRTFRNYCNDEKYKDFFPIFTYVRDKIRAQQIKGGVTQQYNAMLVSRINNIVDKQEVNQTNTNYNIEVSKDEAKRINKDLEADI